MSHLRPRVRPLLTHSKIMFKYIPYSYVSVIFRASMVNKLSFQFLVFSLVPCCFYRRISVLKAKKVCIPVIYSKYEVDKEYIAKIRSRQALFQLKTIVLPKLNKKSSLIHKTRVDPISKKIILKHFVFHSN
jgi:hypothetical protein